MMQTILRQAQDERVVAQDERVVAQDERVVAQDERVVAQDERVVAQDEWMGEAWVEVKSFSVYCGRADHAIFIPMHH